MLSLVLGLLVLGLELEGVQRDAVEFLYWITYPPVDPTPSFITTGYDQSFTILPTGRSVSVFLFVYLHFFHCE